MKIEINMVYSDRFCIAKAKHFRYASSGEAWF